MNLIVCLIYCEIDTVKVSYFCLKRRVLVEINVRDEHLRLKIDLISLVFRLLGRLSHGSKRFEALHGKKTFLIAFYLTFNYKLF